MQYPRGKRIELGDTVRLEGRAKGIVVGLIDDATYAASEWGYLGTGVLVEADDAGLIHYPAPDATWELISRA